MGAIYIFDVEVAKREWVDRRVCNNIERNEA